MPRVARQIDDEILVLRCRGGDAGALEELIRRWAAPLHRHAFRLTNSGDGARDVMQESWLSIVRSLHKLEDPARYRAWMYRVVSNKSIDWVNARRRDRHAARTLREQAEDRSADAAPGLDAADAVDAVRRALRRLPPDRRSLLTMRYLDGLSVSELADVLAVPTGTVKSRLHAAREELREVIESTDRRCAAAAQRKETT